MNTNTGVVSNTTINSDNSASSARPMTFSTLMNFTQLDVESLDFDKMNFAIKKQKPGFSLHSVLARVSARLGLQNNALERATSDLTNQKHNRFRVLAK